MAKFSIDAFRNTILGKGLARKNRFEVSLDPPAFVASNSGIDRRMLSLFVESAVFPELTINAETQYIWGPLIHRPKTVNYGGFMILQFHLDQHMTIKRMFDIWLNSIISDDQYTVSYPKDYVCSGMSVSQLDDQNNEVYRVDLVDAFPASVVQLDANHALQNATHLLQVSFRFRRWYSYGVAGPQGVENAPALPRNDLITRNPLGNRNSIAPNSTAFRLLDPATGLPLTP